MDNIEIYAIPGFREPISSLLHLFAAPVFLVAGFFLVRRAEGNWTGKVSLAIMVLTTVFLLTMSGVYHLLWAGTAKYVLLQLDIAAVFAMIAGTATPVHAILFRGPRRWLPLLFFWGGAATGITLRTVFAEEFPPTVGTMLFLLMGWCGLFSCQQLWKRYGFPFVEPLIWGGVAYSIGAVISMVHWPVLVPGVIGAHEIWHVAVLIGLGLHWRFVFQFASFKLPQQVQPAT